DNRPTREAPATPRREPAADPAASPGDTLGRRQDDPDDQPCLHDLAEDNNHTDEHKAVSRSPNANHSQLDSSYTAYRGDASQSRSAASSYPAGARTAPRTSWHRYLFAMARLDQAARTGHPDVRVTNEVVPRRSPRHPASDNRSPARTVN